MNGKRERERRRTLQRLLTRKADLESIEKWMKEAITWYEEAIWGEEESLRRWSDASQKKTIDKRKLSGELVAEIQDWNKTRRNEPPIRVFCGTIAIEI